MSQLISIVIPCYKASDTLDAVVASIKAEFQKHIEYDYEIILVNDNSPDNTFETISKLCESDNKIIGLDLSKNFGQTTATLAGINYASGEYAVCMDDDGQHPAEGIFQLVEKIKTGFDVVYASFTHKKHSLFKRIVSNMNRMSRKLAGNQPGNVKISSFVAYSRLSISALREYKSPYPSVVGYLMQVTQRFTSIELPHHERLAGQSTYSLKKLIKLWSLSFFNFSVVPLRLSAHLGSFISILGFAYSIYLIIRKIINPNVSAGYTSMMAIILIVGGLQMLMIGICGEYIGKTFISMCGKPQFKVRTELNIKNKYDEDKNE